MHSAQPVDRSAWERRLAGLGEADWNKAFAVGQELAALPAEEGFAILRANWEKVDGVMTRQQLLRGWAFADPNSSRWRDHPRLLDGLDLGMRDRSPAVQVWTLQFLNGLALQDFSEDFRAYKVWFEAHRGRPVAEAVAASARRFAIEAAHSVKSGARKRVQWLASHQNIFQQFPEARRAALDAGLARTLARWAGGAADGSPQEDIILAVQAVYALNQLRPGEAELRRVLVPLLAKDTPPNVRGSAIAALGGPANAWAIDILFDLLKEGLEEDVPARLQTARQAAGALANIGDARVIPRMIALLVAHDSPRAITDVAAYGLGRLTGVPFDLSHDGAWWRAWWEKNREKYPEPARSLEIPNLPKAPKREEEAPAETGPPAKAAGAAPKESR
jgi:hypothetical protein